jgi:peptide/nickel transport system substrate-binding protein
MRRLAALIALAALAMVPGACRKQPEGNLKVVVIGGAPTLRDPTIGPLSVPDQVLLANVAQGLVRFDASGDIVSGLAERWTVSDDGLSYIFRLASMNWPDGRKITAEQVARLIKRQLASRSKNSLKDNLGAIQDIVAMTDREINLIAPRTDLLSYFAQPEMAILRNGQGTGPFTAVLEPTKDDLKLTREIVSPNEETTTREDLLLRGSGAPGAIQAFAAADADLVLGGTFLDLPLAQRVKLPRNSLQFDPASGLFGLVPTRTDGTLADVETRSILSQAIDRDALVAALRVPGLAGRATLLEPGLDGLPPPAQQPWTAIPLAQRRPALAAAAARIFNNPKNKTVTLFLPSGPGSDILFNRVAMDWSALGLTVERVPYLALADFRLIDAVAPSTSPAWFVRQFRCGIVTLCDPDADILMDAARTSPVPAQRYALLGQAAAKIDEDQLFIPLAAPVRWSLVSNRVQNFNGNRYARHTLTDLEAKPFGGD